MTGTDKIKVEVVTKGTQSFAETMMEKIRPSMLKEVHPIWRSERMFCLYSKLFPVRFAALFNRAVWGWYSSEAFKNQSHDHHAEAIHIDSRLMD